MNNKGRMAIGSLMILVVSIFSFAYIIGGIPSISSFTITKDRTLEGMTFERIKKDPTSLVPTSVETIGKTLEPMTTETIKKGFPKTPSVTPSSSSTYRGWDGVDWDVPGFEGKEKFEDKVKKFFAENEFGRFIGHYISAYLSAKAFFIFIGAPAEVVRAGSVAAGFTSGVVGLDKIKTGAGVIGFYIGVFLFTYRQHRFKTAEFKCEPWEPPAGGDFCGLCNSQDFDCTEYQCRSLGAACEFDAEEVVCYDAYKNDIAPPVINVWEDGLPNEKYSYELIGSTAAKVIYSESGDECSPAFQGFSVGITLDEAAKCRWSTDVDKNTYDEMDKEIPGGYEINHTIYVGNIAGVEALEATGVQVPNGGDYNLYITCKDRKDNKNKAPFVFNFCVGKEPDTRAPTFEEFSVPNGGYVTQGIDSFELTVSLDEPAECKWSTTDTGYDDMGQTMTCNKNPLFPSRTTLSKSLWDCKTTLTGIKDSQENKFYFRCKDNPVLEEAKRNTHPASKEYIVHGTEKLAIGEVGPNGTVTGSTEEVEVTLTVETSAGAQEGKANCYFRSAEDVNAGKSITFPFANTDSHSHSTKLSLSEGDYSYKIRCVDAGSNEDTSGVNFDVEVDKEAPIVVRTYKDENSLKIITNEEATCVYDTKNCLYTIENGVPMTSEENEHTVNWNPNVKFYIKCKDEYGRQPGPDECSVIIQPLE